VGLDESVSVHIAASASVKLDSLNYSGLRGILRSILIARDLRELAAVLRESKFHALDGDHAVRRSAIRAAPGSLQTLLELQLLAFVLMLQLL